MRKLALVGAVGIGLCACSPRASIVGVEETASARGVPHLPIAEDSRVVLGAMTASAAQNLRTTYARQTEIVAPPAALVPTDGSELALEAIDVKVDIDGPLARTEIHFTFHNTESRQREGRFSLTLPPNASVARFAMKIGATWREARVVTRAKGREVYEAILKQQRDPALLERDLGNQFSARVFPIAPDEHKEIILAYEHAVGEAQPYVLALRGLPSIPRLAVDVVRDGVTSREDMSHRTPEDLVIPIAGGNAALASGDAFVARVELPRGAGKAALDRVLVLVDTSASRATVMGKQAAAVRAILEALPAHAEVAIGAYDHAVTELYRGDVAGAGGAVEQLFDVGALGASDLGAALAYASSTGLDRVILVGDGMPTLGVQEPSKLVQLVRGIGRIDALQVGATIDRDALGPIVAAGTTPGAILDGRDLARATRQLARALMPERRIHVAGATTWPATTRGVAPGDPVWVFGRRSTRGPLRVEIGNQVVTITPANARPGTRVARAVAGAEVAALTEQIARTTSAPERAQLGAAIEKLALAHSLVSMQTSLIVLESDADERRFLGTPPVDTPEAPKPPRAYGPEHTFEKALRDGVGAQSDSLAMELRQVPGETIEITGVAPSIHTSSTSQGITIDGNYTVNIAVPGRSFVGAGLGAGPINLSGSTSIENRYVVDGVSVMGNSRGSFQVKADVMSAVAQDWIARSIRSGGIYVEPDPDDDDEEQETREAPPASAIDYDTWTHFAAPHEGTYLAVRDAVATGERDRALAVASTAQLANPGDITNVLALGEALEARGAYALAARAYGSLIDLYPNRVELLRAAGQRLDALAQELPAARDLAIDAYRRAIAERPDHAHTYRLLALSLLLANRPELDDEVLPTLRAGASKTTDRAVMAVLAEDRAIAEAVLAARHPERAADFLGATPVELARRPSLRIILAWETDANDVDLHVRDRSGTEAFFSRPALPSGGSLLQDITRGYGPEMFTIIEPTAFPYRIAVHYYSRGPMGVGLGTVQAVRHDGKGTITVQQAPFVIQADQAMIELPALR
ncbi:MAG: VIT domain-containing protein [Kofleriaceae bacterium]